MKEFPREPIDGMPYQCLLVNNTPGKNLPLIFTTLLSSNKLL